MAGFFIAFEGPEGSGKSTQSRLLASVLRDEGWSVLLTREPGGTPISELIRHILLDHANHAMLPQTEALLYSAARSEHVHQLIGPALANGRVVICDRYIDSTLAYQGGGRGLSLADLQTIQEFATDGLTPDLRILLDLPVDVGLRRRYDNAEEVNRLDAADLDFHQRVRQSYQRLVRTVPASWLVIDASDSPKVVGARIADTVRERLGQFGQEALSRTDRAPALNHGNL